MEDCKWREQMAKRALDNNEFPVKVFRPEGSIKDSGRIEAITLPRELWNQYADSNSHVIQEIWGLFKKVTIDRFGSEPTTIVAHSAMRSHVLDYIYKDQMSSFGPIRRTRIFGMRLLFSNDLEEGEIIVF